MPTIIRWKNKMCYLKFHKCRFCDEEYPCYAPNNVCPTINADRDRDMCDECKDVLEKLIKQYDIDVAQVTLEKIMELADE